MLSTPFTQLIGCEVPIQLAPMPAIATPELAAAVSNAGGLGMVGTTMMPPEAVAQILDAVRAHTSKPFGANFLVPFLEDRYCVEVAAAHARVVEFFFGEPDSQLVALAHRGGALVGWQIGSRQEAIAAERAGCDYVVAQGREAGGHVRGTVGLHTVLAEVIESVQIPVLAAGGIATERHLAAVLAAGAAGARIGTRFLASTESGAHPRYVELLLAASAEDTVYTEAFSVMWPNAPHRVLRSCVAAAENLEAEIIGEVPDLTGTMPVPRFSVIAPTRETTGNVEAMALYAGESVSSITRIEPAAEIVRRLTEGAARFLEDWRGGF
jgi:NAD(P)H-dependent flavin oxidoreductase YrpB (nitropropane dioxygenase family)